MSFALTSSGYAAYLTLAAQKIAENGDYITGLDAITGDGDHWVNINKGFSAMAQSADEWAALPIEEMFKKIGMLMMSKVGGSSGILYGGAYMAAAKVAAGKPALSSQDLCAVLNAMVEDMMARGKAQPGYKTMIDTLYPAAQAYKEALAAGKPDAETLAAVKAAAQQGAEDTKAMEAVKGRASYQKDKGVGHLDPGAVTMCYQIETLCDYIQNNLLG